MPLPVDILFLRTHAHKLVIPNPRAPFKLNCRGVRDLLFGLQGIPAGDYNRARQLLVTHRISNFRLFKPLRTLSCPEHDKTARFKTATLLFSARSALFTKNTGGGVEHAMVASILPYSLPSCVGAKSFVCHSYENCRGVGLFFPFWNSLPTAKNAATRETLQRFNVPTLRRSNGSSRTVLLQTLPRSDRMAVYAPDRSKYQETKPLPLVSKNKESGQRVRQGLSPRPGRRSILVT